LDKKIVDDDKNEHLYEIMESASKFYQYYLFNSITGEKALKYLSERKLSNDIIKHFGIGLSPKDGDSLYQFLRSKDYSVTDMINLGLVKQADNGSYYDLFFGRLMFPIKNEFGKIIAFSGRSLNKDDNIKYINSPESILFKKGEVIYNFHAAKLPARKLKTMILVEGFFDVISTHQAGIENVIATMGTALTLKQAKLIKKNCDKIILAYDGDNAGIKASISAIKILMGVGLLVEVLAIPDRLDPDDYILKFGTDRFKKILSQELFDPYEFQYNIYKRGLNLNNVNDINIFKENIYQMLKNSDNAISSFYKNKIADELKINLDKIERVTLKPKITENKIVLKVESKYEKAECALFSIMLKSRENFERISSEINENSFTGEMSYEIMLKIKDNYEKNYTFKLEEFIKNLSFKAKEFYQERIENYFEGCDFIIDDEYIGENIKVLNEKVIDGEIADLRKKIMSSNGDIKEDLDNLLILERKRLGVNFDGN